MRSLSRRPDAATAVAAHITREQWDAIVHDWLICARDDQLAPVLTAGGEAWHTWLVLGGRGSGKTRAGAEWVRAQALATEHLADRRAHRIALIGETIGQVRSVMIEGLSGLFSIHAAHERPKLEASRNQLVWPNGSIAQMFAADDPDSLRGPQFDAAWCDELTKWRVPDYAWDTLQFALRLGELPQCVVTTTPRHIPLLKKIMDDKATVTSRSRTADNAKHLAPAFLAEMQRRYGDTALGRQELEGEIVVDRMTGLWKRSHIAQGRVLARPELTRIVVAVDPPVSATTGSDSCGIIVAGLGIDKRGYVIGDRTIQGRDPATWAHAAVAAYHDYAADRIVVETNQGGDLVVQVFKSIDANLPVKKVHARFVLLDAAVTLVDMGPDEIGLAYTWRCGPANRGIGHPSYLETTHAFQGLGLRPLSPVHVRGAHSAGDLSIAWVRRTRIGGDGWDAVEVPLGEETERYEVDILDGVDVVRTLAATIPAATYTAAQQTADFGSPQSSIDVRVCQLSTVFGRGTPHEVTL